MLRINLKPSRQLTLFLIVGHLIAAACVVIVPLQLGLKVLLLGMLLMSLLFNLRHQSWRAWPFSIIALQFERDSPVFMQFRNGKTLEAQVLESSVVTPYLTILLLKPNQSWFARSVVLMPDMLTAERFRVLRVWLKWGVGRNTAPKTSVDWTGQS